MAGVFGIRGGRVHTRIGWREPGRREVRGMDVWADPEPEQRGLKMGLPLQSPPINTETSGLWGGYSLSL